MIITYTATIANQRIGVGRPHAHAFTKVTTPFSTYIFNIQEAPSYIYYKKNSPVLIAMPKTDSKAIRTSSPNLELPPSSTDELFAAPFPSLGLEMSVSSVLVVVSACEWVRVEGWVCGFEGSIDGIVIEGAFVGFSKSTPLRSSGIPVGLVMNPCFVYDQGRKDRPFETTATSPSAPNASPSAETAGASESP